MRPYLEMAHKYLPPDTEIERLGAWSYGTSRGLNCHASIFQNRAGDPFRIWLHTDYDAGRFSKIDLLANLAHELAHTVSWKHTPEHKRLEAKLSGIFMTQLRKDGYTSEEAELQEYA